MKIKVLLVNYGEEAQNLYLPLLTRNGIIVHFAHDMSDALVMLVDAEYSGIVINGDNSNYLPLLKVMRRLTTVPIGVSVTQYNMDENHNVVMNGADIYRVRYDEAERRSERFASLVKIYVEYTAGKKKPMTVITHGELQVFPNIRKVYVQGVDTRLAAKEFDILHYLIMNKGIVLSRVQIYRHVWGNDYADYIPNLLWVHMSRLRRKLQIDPSLPEYIITERSFGYTFNPGKKAV